MSEKRISSRTTKGRPPSRLGEWDSVSKASRTSSKAAELEVLVAEKEFEAAEELAQLEMETAEQLAKKRLELQRDVIQKRLAADKAAVALELSSVGSRHSVAGSEAMMPIASAGKETQSPRLTTSLLERHAQFLRRLELSNLDTGAGKPRQGAVTLSRAGFDADPRPEEEGDLDQQGPENGAQSLPDLSKVQLSNSVDLQTAAADLLGSVPVPVDRVDSSGAAVGAQGTGSDHSSIASVSWDHHQGVNSTGRVLAVAKPAVQAQPSRPQPSSHQSQRQITIHPATQVSRSRLNPGPGPSALNYNPVSSIRPGLAGVRYGLPAMTQPVTASVNTHLGPGVGRSYSVATTTSTSVTCGVTPSNWKPVTVQSSFAPISSVQGHSHRAQKSAATTVPAPAAAVLSGPEQLQIYNSMLSRQHLRPLELPRFSGKTNDYSRWKQRFKQLIDDDAFLSEGHKFARLREALTGGDAYELIAEIVDGPGAYNAALHELDAWYGGPTRDIDRYEKELMSAPRLVNERDLDGLKSFAVKLRNALINLSASGITPGRELYLSVTQKVPKSVLTRFMEKHDDSQCDIGAFSEYLLKRVQRLRQVEERMSGAELAEQRPSSGGAKFGKRPDRTFVATIRGQSPDSRNGCIYCNKDHALSDCREFKQLTIPQRWDFIKPKPVCICCFGPGHKAKSCKQSKCSICSRPHHRLLHYTKLNQRTTGANSQHSKDRSASCQDTSTESSAADKTAHTQTACGTTIEPKSVAFMTVATTAKGPTGSRKANVFLDSGSSCSFITSELVSQLGLQTTKANVPLDTAVLGGEKLRLEHYTSAELCHADGQSSTTVRVWMLPRIMRPVPAFDWTEELKRWPHLSDVVPASNESRVDLLIGLNAPQLHISLAERFCSEGGPIARKTPLGWVLFGEGPTDSASEMTEQSLLAVSDSTLINTVNKFWDLESVGMQAKSTSSYLTPDEREADAMTVQSLHHNGTRFVVGIPWRGDGSKPKIQQRSEQYARKRLCSLHRLFQKNPTVQLRYSEVLQNYLKKGYIHTVSTSAVQAAGVDQWILPHFPVIREDKATTKVRVVFDGSAKVHGECINDLMHTGPKLQSDLVKVLLRFCHQPIALAADISEMFLQVELRETDRKYHRFMWSESPQDPVVFFEFCRVVFGMRASPYLAGRALKATAEKFSSEAGAEVAKAIDDNFYVDDLLMSLPSVQSAIVTRSDLQQVTQRGGFHLRMWMSNTEAVLDSIPLEDRASNKMMTIASSELPPLPHKALGVAWEPDDDQFTFIYPEPSNVQFTRRGVLSQMCRLFDPRGQLCPFTIRSRILFQATCIRGTDWDDPLDSDQASEWKQWFSEFPSLRDVKASRCFTEISSDQPLTLHTFTDASASAYAAVTYARQERDDGTAKVTLALAKARPTPIKRKTIPMLELQGAVLGTRLSCSVGEALDVPVSRQYFYTDSMNVLYWVRSPSRKFKIEVGNRISEIQEFSNASQWCHVSTTVNPADMPSRGVGATQLADDATWWTGPAFLSKPTSTWPSKHIVPPAELPGQLKREITMVATTQELPTSRLHPDHFSSWDHLVRITAWCRRFVNNARRRSTQAASPEIATKSVTLPTGRNVSVPELTVSELWSAKCVWISLAQREVYGRTFADVTGGKGLSASSPLQKLQPVLDATSGVGVLKVNGRLRTAHHLPPGIRTPVILPRSHRTTKLIIAAADANANHAVGTNHLLSLLAGEYWIVKGKAAVKEHRSKCILCRKRYVKTATPAMAPLPNFRTSGPQQPFAKVGVDYAGPFHTRQGRGRSQAKRYVCVFTCLLTRACHFELVYSLDTAGFLLALSRFTKRRGVPQKMVSDNGTNFVAADQELRAAVKSLDTSRLAAEMTSRGISWAFNPPRAPHFGGVFEVMVKSMKRVLQGVLYRADLTDEELHTALVNAEDLINSRPLCTMTSDVEDLQPLTPQHFLVGHANSTMAAEVNITTETQVHPRKRWEVVQRIIDDVWKRWLKEIVPKLNVQVKWLQKQRNVQEGDVVLVMDEHTARSHWPLGRVTEVYPGKDGIVRVVKVKVAERFYKRAVHRLVPLEVEGTE
ncbi:uncharacterized protein LOC135816555 [Sycon ciliatum]|uniref:uncharacterized protein LOC135816555 n=1 Tax=Sycon ciliatum TaxID=27933 RepID=UPI0031F6CF93